MHVQTKIGALPVLLFIVALFQATPALARSDALIQREIEAQIAESATLRSARIEVHVDQGLVVLAGEVRLYEQKLVSERIAWTTPSVFEVDNEIQVAPKLALSDAAIERKIGEILKADERFHTAGIVVKVNNGEVLLSGSFFGFRDPSILKHKVAKIEGVLSIEIRAQFLAGKVSQ